VLDVDRLSRQIAREVIARAGSSRWGTRSSEETPRTSETEAAVRA
jgi:hypothetical protein